MDNYRTNELIHISTHPETHEMKATDFFKSHQISYSEPIKSIFQDSRENQWILTENGLYRLTRNGNEEKLSSYFVAPPEKDKQPFTMHWRTIIASTSLPNRDAYTNIIWTPASL